MNAQMNAIVDEVIQALKEKVFIPVEASGRHIHLSKEHIETLFGKGYHLTPIKDLSQPGQYACKERVTITGSKGSMKNVIVLGPPRKDTQVEISLTDALILGVPSPIRQSGDIKDTPGIQVSHEERHVQLTTGLIVAKRHIHMTPEDGIKFNVTDGEVVKVKVFGTRPLIFDDVIVRINPSFRTAMHIDYDEANACGYNKDSWGILLK